MDALPRATGRSPLLCRIRQESLRYAIISYRSSRTVSLICGGYCDGEDTSHSFGVWAHSLSAQTYQKLIDRGWRRSGHYLYRPNLRRSCCKSYTIRLDATRFKPDRKHRQALNKFNRYILGEEWIERRDALAESAETPVKEVKNKEPKSRNKYQSSGRFDLRDTLHAAESGRIPENLTPVRTFEITFTNSTCTEEKYQLYKKYQIKIHGDEPSKVTKAGFTRFLCDSPIHAVPLPSAVDTKNLVLEGGGDPLGYGSYHQLYRIDAKLVALAVLDILPNCVSSVYFIYDPDYAHLSLGRVSACRELSLALDIAVPVATTGIPKSEVRKRHDGLTKKENAEDVEDRGRVGGGWYYMGFYIPSCAKMAYKGEYAPSSLVDPCSPLLHPTWISLPKFERRWELRKRAVSAAETKGEKEEEEEEAMDWFVSFLTPDMKSLREPLRVPVAEEEDTDLSHPSTLSTSDMPGLMDEPAMASLSLLKLFDSGQVFTLDEDDWRANPKLLKCALSLGTILGQDILTNAIMTV